MTSERARGVGLGELENAPKNRARAFGIARRCLFARCGHAPSIGTLWADRQRWLGWRIRVKIIKIGRIARTIGRDDVSAGDQRALFDRRADGRRVWTVGAAAPIGVTLHNCLFIYLIIEDRGYQNPVNAALHGAFAVGEAPVWSLLARQRLGAGMEAEGICAGAWHKVGASRRRRQHRVPISRAIIGRPIF